MSYTAKMTVFVAALLAGSFVIYAISPLLTFFLVSITGQGWLFPTLKWILLIIFWIFMFWQCLPKKGESDVAD